MSRIIVILCIVIVCSNFICRYSWGAPSFQGYTGLLNVPSADVLDSGGYNLGFHNTDLDITIINAFCANYGAKVETLTSEFGMLKWNPKNGASETLLNAKCRIKEQTAISPAIAIGIYDLTNEINSTVYVVVSKRFSLPSLKPSIHDLNGHLGIGGGKLKGFFMGLDVAIDPKTTAIAEYDSEDINFGLRMNLLPNVFVDAALLDFGHLGFGISYVGHF